MSKQKTKKTAAKRFKVTNPRGRKKAKVMYNKASDHHFKTKRSSRVKRRKPAQSQTTPGVEKNIRAIISNINSLR